MQINLTQSLEFIRKYIEIQLVLGKTKMSIQKTHKYKQTYWENVTRKCDIRPRIS